MPIIIGDKISQPSYGTLIGDPFVDATWDNAPGPNYFADKYVEVFFPLTYGTGYTDLSISDTSFPPVITIT